MSSAGIGCATSSGWQKIEEIATGCRRALSSFGGLFRHEQDMAVVNCCLLSPCVAGEVRGLPYPAAQTDREGQVILMSTDRARDFLARVELSNIGPETLDQLTDDVRRLVIVFQQQPLPILLGDLVDTQDRAFTLLEGRQRPEQSRDLYLLAGFTCGLMARASVARSGRLPRRDDPLPHRLRMSRQRRSRRLRAWTRGLQALITYRSGQWEDSVRHAQSGAQSAAPTRPATP